MLLAQAIKQSIRKSDYAIRLGGDNSASFLSIRRRKLQHNCLNVSKKRLQHIAPQKEIGFLPVFTR